MIRWWCREEGELFWGEGGRKNNNQKLPGTELEEGRLMINRHSIGMRKQWEKHKKTAGTSWNVRCPDSSTFKVQRATAPPCGSWLNCPPPLQKKRDLIRCQIIHNSWRSGTWHPACKMYKCPALLQHSTCWNILQVLASFLLLWPFLKHPILWITCSEMRHSCMIVFTPKRFVLNLP